MHLIYGQTRQAETRVKNKWSDGDRQTGSKIPNCVLKVIVNSSLIPEIFNANHTKFPF